MMEEKRTGTGSFRRCTMEQKIKQQSGINIGGNIRRIRLSRGIRQTELVRMIQLQDVNMTKGDTGKDRERDPAYHRCAASRTSGLSGNYL